MNAVVDITFLQFQINSLKVTKTCQSEGHRKRFQPIIVCSSSNQQHKLRLLEIQKKKFRTSSLPAVVVPTTSQVDEN